jgi:hypothetical protein
MLGHLPFRVSERWSSISRKQIHVKQRMYFDIQKNMALLPDVLSQRWLRMIWWDKMLPELRDEMKVYPQELRIK